MGGPNGSLRSRGTKPANPVSRNIWRPVSGQHGNGNHSTSLQSQVSHTPSPKPQREAISSPASNPLSDRRGSGGQLQSPPTRRSALERLSEVEATAPTGERLSAFERISSPPTRVPLLLNGIANSDSGRLQEVNIQYLEEMFPYNTPEALSNPSRPSSSIPPPSDVHIDAGMLERSPIRTLSEDRAHVSLRLGPLSDSELTDSPPMTLKSAGKRKVTKPARAPSTRKTPRSPAQGISLNKRHIAKAQSSPKRLAKRGYILASEAVLKEICTREEFELIKKSSRTLAQEVAGAELTDKDDSDSFGGSSSHRLEVQEPPFVGGVISLDDVHSEEEPKGS
ncbi:hypothetical protein Bca52824_017619 [Brassica carinata]|uniref:Uncharacterized protein n=1 Tax=Brassica carinata TaxID=52824 RepID=A0A8X8AXJ9_BRACI|nr:hypothetical protein Bca52824_017619 [Brassica carinata]